MLAETCKICHRQFDLEKNLSGLVFDDEHFVCEECNQILSDDDKNELMESVMGVSKKGMPIALWLIQEQNKGKSFMSMKK